MQRSSKIKVFMRNNDGLAVVEATFVFPIMFMVFFALVMLAFYLPQRAMLQRATQFAATSIATEMSDTWIYYDADAQKMARYGDHKALQRGKGGVYKTLFNSMFGGSVDGGEGIVKNVDQNENIPMIANGELKVECELINYIVYKEVAVTATRSIPILVDFSAIKFPKEVVLTVTSKAVVQNGDEFVRNLDLAADVVKWTAEKYPAVGTFFEKIDEVGSKINGFFGI